MEVLFDNNLQIPAKSQTQSLNPIPLSSLISALDLAAQSTKTLPSSSETLAALRSAHDLIGSFLSQIGSDKFQGQDEDELMIDRGDEGGGGGGEESKIIEEVEEGMRECVLQSKRRKRRVSPSSVAGRAADQGEELSAVDSMERRRSAIDLVFQFHA